MNTKGDHRQQDNGSPPKGPLLMGLSLLVPLLLCGLFFPIHCLYAADEQAAKDTVQWSLLGGYGSSHPGWGDTETRVETLDIIARRSSIIIDDMGSSWFRGYHSLLIELPIHYLLDYNEDPMIGLNFLANYTFTSWSLKPYIFIGGGPVYVSADIPGMGSDWNGSYQIGLGINLFQENTNSLFLEARYHHISNGNSEDPNEPLNSAKFLIGYTF